MGGGDLAEKPTVSASRVRYQVLAVACSVAVVSYVHRLGFSSTLPKVSKELHFSDQQASWLTAIFLIAYGGFEIPCGLIGDRLGVRHLLTLLVLGWSVVTGCLALVGLLPQEAGLAFAFVLCMRFLFGMFQAGAFPALSRMMTDRMPVKKRGSAQGLPTVT